MAKKTRTKRSDFSINFVIKDNFSNIDRVLTLYGKELGEINELTAMEMQKFIKRNWSSSSPSAPHTPPAKRTGNLDKSIVAEVAKQSFGNILKQGKHAPQAWRVNADTYRGGDNQNRGQYSMAVEYGEPRRTRGISRAPRPFFRPAVAYAKGFYKVELQKRFKV